MAWPERICTGILALAVGACAGNQDPLAPHMMSDETANVYPTNYKSEILAYLRTYLNDPTGIRDAAIGQPALRPVHDHNRYVVCLRFSARKSSGSGYAGAKDNMMVFVAGKLDRLLEAGARETCKDDTLAAFPELEHLTR